MSTTAGAGQQESCPEEFGCSRVSSSFCICCVECISKVCTVIKKIQTLEANQKMGAPGHGVPIPLE